MFALILSAFLAPAWADPDDIDLDDDEIDIGESTDPAPAPAPAPPPAPDEPPPPDDADEEDDLLDDFREEGDEIDLLDEEPQVSSSGDTEQVYRATMARLQKMEPDEELAGWEAYLAQYPQSVYRTRIETRMDELADSMYTRGIGQSGATGQDAMRAELEFAQGLQLENINPRTKIQLGFEWGLPSYANGIVDYEHALARNFSVHAGIRRRYLGWNGEAGLRWSPVKSLRTNMLVTLMLDLRLNTNPVYPGVRPQLAIGKRFGIVDAQIQGGPDLTLVSYTDATGAKTTEFKPLYTGGANLFFAFTERVGAFAETSFYVQSLPAEGGTAFDGGVFQFNVVTFGLKFFPGQDTAKRDKEVNFGATVPYAQSYWQWHYGSVMGQFNYYL
jgi:hypothetical protein